MYPPKEKIRGVDHKFGLLGEGGRVGGGGRNVGVVVNGIGFVVVVVLFGSVVGVVDVVVDNAVEVVCISDVLGPSVVVGGVTEDSGGAVVADSVFTVLSKGVVVVSSVDGLSNLPSSKLPFPILFITMRLLGGNEIGVKGAFSSNK